VTRNCNEVAEREYGIEVVDVQLKRINFPEQNLSSVFDRMMAERHRIARKYRAEGEEQSLKIAAETDKQEKEILADAYMQAQQLIGEGEAAAARIYAGAYSRNPSFYKLLRTLEAYEKIMDDRTTVVLTADSALLKLLMEGNKGDDE
jgi:membrane protease subunit HflC